MRYLNFVMFFLLTGLGAAGTLAQEMKYPPVGEYLMPQGAEIALAKSAAPDNISGKATIKILTASGFQVVHEGDNGFVCMVMRGSGRRRLRPRTFATSSTTPNCALLSVSTTSCANRSALLRTPP